MATEELLESLERCRRAGYWAYEWQKSKWAIPKFLEAGVRAGLLESKRKDYGLVAGESLYELAIKHELESKQMDVHSEVVHLSAVSEIVVSAIRKPTDDPWLIPETLDGWTPSCYLSPDGSHLRRIVFVSSWNDERHNALCRSWGSLGPVCFYRKPMQIVVVMLGAHRDGKYHSFWTRALQHPKNRALKFRKKNAIDVGFKDSWNPIWREDWDQYSTQDWLEQMLADDVLRDVLFRIDLELPTEVQCEKIVDLAKRKLDEIDSMRELPDPNLSTCFWPISCDFLKPCHANSAPSGKWGFVSTADLS